MPEVTIIMPALNVENFIEECLESVRNQTFYDIEILVIDAGSTDGTVEIIQRYAKEDVRITLIRSDKKSYGYQLNMGIRLARGRYICIVETDDWIDKDMVRVLYDAITSENYDYVKGAAKSFWRISKDILITADIKCIPGECKKMNPSQHPELFVTDRYLWLGIYRADFIKTIQLTETPGAAYQDIGFIYQVLNKATRACYIDRVIYYYRQDNQNASGYSHKAFKYLVDEFSVILDQKNSKEWLPAVYQKLAVQNFNRFQNMALSGCFWTEYEHEIEIIRKRLLEAEKDGLLDIEKLVGNNEILFRQWHKGARELYLYYKGKFDEMIFRLKSCLEAAKDRPVVVFGAGRYGKFFHALCENRYPQKVVGYCDNKQELWGRIQQGVKIYEPEKAAEQFVDALFVICIIKEGEKVREQLLGMGIPQERIVVYKPDYYYLLFNAEY